MGLKDLLSWVGGLKKKSKRLYQSSWQDDGPESALNTPMSSPTLTYDTYMGLDSTTTANYATNPVPQGSYKEKKDERIVKKPVEVVKELLMEVPIMDLADLDKKIKAVTKRAKMLKEELEVNPRDEEIALGFLKARKKYEKNKDLFKWAVTGTKNITELLKKYKLREANFAGYYKCVPTEALDEVEKFIRAYVKVREDKPFFKLIVDEGGKETKKDPILLAGSPFGKWFYVLGAWDKEIEYVDELLYRDV